MIRNSVLMVGLNFDSSSKCFLVTSRIIIQFHMCYFLVIQIIFSNSILFGITNREENHLFSSSLYRKSMLLLQKLQYKQNSAEDGVDM